METGGVASGAWKRRLDEKQILMEETRIVSLRDACSHDLRSIQATGPVAKTLVATNRTLCAR
jgi:hypothetical protein